MPLQLIHVSDIHFGSGESHGFINAKTGLNIRFEDFVAAFSKVVQYAIEERADAFLFSGDAYKNASPEPIYQKMFAGQLKRLSDANIKTILLVGNHDQVLRTATSHAMSVFQSLEVPGVLIVDKPLLTKIDTRGGAFQLIGIPHVTRNQLPALEKDSNIPIADIDQMLIKYVTDLLAGFYNDFDSSLPTVSTAHMTVDRAVAGIEQELLIGSSLTFPTDIFIHPRIDYVALGHVHRHQVLRRSNPAIVYAGSLERVDFGEEREDKGFVHVRLERGKTSFEFRSINPRPFVTIDLDLVNEGDPLEKLCQIVDRSTIPGCVLRIRYKLKQEQLAAIDYSRVRKLCERVLTVRLQPEVLPSFARARLPQLNEDAIASPLVALETYLAEFVPDRKDSLIKLAKEIVNEVALNSNNDQRN